MKAKTILSAILIVLVLCGLSLAEWTEPVPVTEINTEFADWTPFLSFDGLSLYFARGRTSSYYYFRIFEATREEPYGAFTSVNEVFSSSGKHVFWPWISPDNLRMYYFVQTVSPILWQFKVSERVSVNDPWPQGTDISELNALGRIQSPRLTADELIIFFDSPDIPGEGGFDIWTATRPDRNSPLDSVTNQIGINTASNEAGGFVSPDGLTLIFQSDRNGYWQLFKATRQSLTEPFDNIEHLSIFDMPEYTNQHPCLSSDGSALYFIRLLDNNLSTVDIYVSYLIVDPYEDAINSIVDAIAEKLDALDKVNSALEKEWAAYEALQELLESRDYGDLKKSDIISAMRKIYSSIRYEQLTKKALDRSIEKLEDSLAALGWQPLPEPVPSLVAHWKFDECQGTIAYDSVGTNHGTIYGATWTTGQVGCALSFDGVDDYVNVADNDDSLDIDNYITITAWVKLNDLGDYYFIAGKQPTGTSRENYPGNYIFRTAPSDGNLHFHHQTGTGDHEYSRYSSTSGIGPGAWHHVSVTLVEGGNVNFYIDGSPAGTLPQEGVFGLFNDEPVRIGTRKDEWSYFNGLLDDIMIFDIALSAQEIQQLYHNSSEGLYSQSVDDRSKVTKNREPVSR